ncbi:unnamed protein product [Vitrella brassicaformis CCMP3155]|uniref:Apyrase n=1 Tax=Vitrella brassicaformis (strain CCMP3155) TaxID=1169540 RepID=A0A0G4EIJ4_VITBC|nr:unnamed protein product [Vitrella brassicaformis CCMP3155]|eukprot:CEL95823.1 unnamed protein product [Vitrella brassicaformis CCMP3155]
MQTVFTSSGGVPGRGGTTAETLQFAVRIIALLTIAGFVVYLVSGWVDSVPPAPPGVAATDNLAAAGVGVGEVHHNQGSGSKALPHKSLRRAAICTMTNPCKIQLIADLDESSRDESQGKLTFFSYLQSGYLYRVSNRGGGFFSLGGSTESTSTSTAVNGSSDKGADGKEASRPQAAPTYAVEWGASERVDGHHNEAGRGMELSELLQFDNVLYTFDDRTGIVYELDTKKEGKASVYPRHIVTEGAGDTNKGMKIEWATQKDGNLWIGSFGKEYTNAKGEIVNENNMWVVALGANGKMQRFNWKPAYDAVRRALGAPYPGYCIHEAVAWSDDMQKWVLLPRRVSSDPYDDEQDEYRGSNKLVLASEDFSQIEVREIGDIVPERGYSSFAFIPGTDDQVIVALKSVESAKTKTQSTYLSVFHINGDVYLPDTEVPGGYKYEGIEIIS